MACFLSVSTSDDIRMKLHLELAVDCGRIAVSMTWIWRPEPAVVFLLGIRQACLSSVFLQLGDCPVFPVSWSA